MKPRGKSGANSTPPVLDGQIMTVPEVAAYLRIAPTSVYRLLRRGLLPGFKIGSEWRFHRGHFDRWMEEQSIGNRR